MTLRDLAGLQPLYILPEDDLVGEVLVPCLRQARAYDCMIGFFSSAVFRELAPGLADFLSLPHSQMRLLMSPYLSPQDQRAMLEGLQGESELLARRLEEVYGAARVDRSALVKHALECLAYLISTERLLAKVVLVRDGLFHPKVWLFSDGDGWLVAHGSSNLTGPAVTTNVEQVSIARSWLGGDHATVVNRLVDTFGSIWQGRASAALRVYDLPEAFRGRVVRDYQPERVPEAADFWAAWESDVRDGIVKGRPGTSIAVSSFERRRLRLPPGLEYGRGDFAHQARAVEAWEAAGRRGILEMATGSGKTVSALIAATRLLEQTQPLLLVIAVPYRPLLTQWSREVQKFSLMPVLPSAGASRSAKLERIAEVVRNLRLGIADVECMVVTHDMLKDAAFREQVGRYAGPSMLIGDEVHALGTSAFLKSAPESFVYRLGLSATPIRQYDDVGSAGIKAYFGDVAFRFTLEEAIGRCLVPYHYYVHEVYLDPSELEEWLELTARLQALGWRLDRESQDEGLPPDLLRVLVRRRKVLEQSSGKLPLLRQLLSRTSRHEVRHTLVYASDKGREQLDQVNHLLMDDLGLRVHQITQDETGDAGLTEDLIESFARGDGIQVLTAMRVLDEGIDIPEVSTAYILASTTVERQWVQRRGRVLRKCARVNKKHAAIHDFLVLPPRERGPDYYGSEILGVLRGELARIMAFAKTSLNAAAPGGALQVVQPLVREYF